MAKSHGDRMEIVSKLFKSVSTRHVRKALNKCGEVIEAEVSKIPAHHE